MSLFYNILGKLAEAALLLPFLLFPWRAVYADGLAFHSSGHDFTFVPAIIVLFLLLLGQAHRKQSVAARVKKSEDVK